MRNEGKTTRLSAIATVLILLGAGFAALGTSGDATRNPGLDVAVTGITTQKDIDDPSGSALYPTGPTDVTVAVKNTGDASTQGFNVKLDVGKGSPVTRFYADAESPSLPGGWSVTNFTVGKWHTTSRQYSSGANSAWCGPNGTTGVQYGPGWEEEMYTTSAIAVPSANPMLFFNQLFFTKLFTDGGFIEIRNTSNSPDTWDHMSIDNWTFIQGNYNSTTASINPLSQDEPCFGGDSGGWQNIGISLMNYAGGSIQIKFTFSSSSTLGGDLSGWYIDDVRVTDGTTTTFSDDFETGMGRWTVMNNLGDIPTAWQTLAEPAPSYNASSTRCFSNTETVVNNTYFQGEDSALVSPDIPLAGVTNARLYFWYKMRGQSNSDGGFVEVWRAGMDWTHLDPFMKEYPSTVDADSPYGSAGAYNSTDLQDPWVRATFDLSPFVGGNVKVRFHFSANRDAQVFQGWSIDEVTVIAWDFVQVDSQPRSISPLGVGASDNATYKDINISQEGIYILKATVQLPGDTVPQNDMAYVIIEVRDVLSLELLFNRTMPDPVVHGRKADLGVTVWNTGNKQNDVELTNGTPPPGFTVTFTRTQFLVAAGGKAFVGMNVTVPLDQPNGEYSFTVNASSRLDPGSYSEKRVDLRVENNPPTAVVLAQSIGLVFTPILFDGRGSSDPDDDPLEYAWDFGDGGTGSGAQANHSFAEAGRYTVTLNVSDGGPGSFATASTEINISDKEPVALFDIDTPINNGTYQKDTEVVFNATRSRDEAPALLNFTWDFGDNSEYGYGALIGHTYTSGGLFTVTLTVTDPAGQQNAYAEDVIINNPPVANISAPLDNQIFYTTDEVLFSSNGSYDPDDNALTFQWTDNQLPDQLLSTSPFFSRTFSTVGRHVITLTVFDGKGPVSFSYDQVTIEIAERTNQAPTLRDGMVDPTSGDEGAVFRYSVTYTDLDGDVPDYVQLIIDGRDDTPHTMLPVDIEDNDFTDGKAYYFCTTALRGEDSPHSFAFVTADRHGSGEVSSGTLAGPVVKWVRDLGKDSPDSTKLRGKVYQTGPHRTILTIVNNATPPELPAGKVALGLAFTMNTTAPAGEWYWANITVLYSSLDFSRVNESSLRLYWSIDGGPWTQVPESGLDMDSQVLWMRVTQPSAKFAVLGNPVSTKPVGPTGGNQTAVDDTMTYLAVAGVVVAALVIMAAVVYLRRKPVVPPEPALQLAEEAPPPPSVERKWAKTEEVARPDAMVGTSGEEVKVFRPSDGEVKVFRPGGEEKIFKPAETEEEEKIFRPGAREVVQEEAREPPVVDEEVPREKVVEYQEGAEEEESSMPGARPAEEEVEASEESETAGESPAGEPEPSPPKKDEAAPKKQDDSLDDLLDELNK